MHSQRHLLLMMLVVTTSMQLSNGSGRNQQFDITSYGAIAGSTLPCTRAIQSAIDAAKAAAPSEVLVPAGRFVTGSFALATGVKLHLGAGAVLLASTEPEDYPTQNWTSPVQGWNWDPALIDTANCSNTGIIGAGIIDGQQPKWVRSFDPHNNFLNPITWNHINGCQGECRPKLVRFTDCTGVTVTGVTLQNSPDWTQLYRRCSNVLLQGITVLGSQQWGNNDGVDFESGDHIRVIDSFFHTGDDGIVFASGNTNANRESSPGLPLTDIIIRNCTLSSKSSAIKWEAIDFGGCAHGDISNVLVEDVKILNSSRGIGFQLRNGPGSFRNATVRRVSISTLYPTGTNWWGSGEPIWVTIIPQKKKEAGGPGKLGTIEDIVFQDITISSENGILLSGIGRPFGPILLENVSIDISVLGNATCRKGYPGSPAGCSDYRPLDCQIGGSSQYCPNFAKFNGINLPQQTAAIRLEGAGSVKLSKVSASYSYSGQQRPSWWATQCIAVSHLNHSFDPWYRQHVSVYGTTSTCKI